MLLDICTELLEDVRNGWEYRELETEKYEKDRSYTLEIIKYESGKTIYWCMILNPDGEPLEGGSIVCDSKKELLNCTPKELEKLCNQSYYYNIYQVE